MKISNKILPFLLMSEMMNTSIPIDYGNNNLKNGSKSRDKVTFTKKIWQKRKRKLKIQSNSRKINRI